MIEEIKRIIAECDEIVNDRGESEYAKAMAMIEAYKKIRREMGIFEES